MAGAVGTASGTAVRRLRHELESLRRSQVPQIAVQPSENDLLEWHFVLHSLPTDTPYHGGVYHGKIVFPAQYPLAPPAILMVTPSGRLETGKRLCLSMTDFHPESWNPAWSVETILVGLLSFFVSDKERGYGAIAAPKAKRRELAVKSRASNARDAEFRALFPEFIEGEDGSAAVEEEEAGADPVSAAAAAPVEVPEQTSEGAEPETEPAPPSAAPAASATTETADPPAALEEGRVEEEEERVCWICREETDEPLIQPCACRGSMSGVHASCVEAWIRHHRRNAVSDEPPKCSVCNQPYTGQELRPGMGTFLQQKCCQCTKKFLRTLVLVVLVVGYQLAADDQDLGLPKPLRVACVVVFALVALHKLALLTVSLPLHRPPPQDPRLQFFFVSDYSKLSMHIAEAFVTVVVLNFQCIFGTLPLAYFLPVGLAGLVPILKVCFRHTPSRGCIFKWLQAVFILVTFPLLCVGFPLVWAARNPKLAAKRLVQSLNPVGPGPQVYSALAGLTMCWVCSSNVAPVVLWVSHSSLAVLGLLELFLVQKLPWRRTNVSPVLWVFGLQLTILTAYFANTLTVFTEGWGEPDHTLRIVHTSSLSWLALISLLTLKVNWGYLMERYRVWQRRHGTFTLQVPAAGASEGSRAPLRQNVVDAQV